MLYPQFPEPTPIPPAPKKPFSRSAFIVEEVDRRLFDLRYALDCMNIKLVAVVLKPDTSKEVLAVLKEHGVKLKKR